MSTTNEQRVTRLALAGGTPALAVALWLLWSGDYAARTQWTLSVIIVIAWLAFAFAVRERVIRPLQTLSNMLAALRERDYSLRARRQGMDDALGLVIFELNVLTEELKQRRLGSLEATALLERVMSEIDVAVFTFDANDVLQLVNASGERLLAQEADRILGRRADELGLAECLRGEAPRVQELEFPVSKGRWEVRRGSFRQEGKPHQLLVLADVSRTLREEERQAWQRLIRVLGHEINNSLTPIKSVAQRLTELLSRPAQDGALKEDLEKGLALIAGRSESLTRFLSAYTRLARLPSPKLASVDVPAWIERVARLETRTVVAIVPGTPVVVLADGDQLDQLLINLIANATDAALTTGGGVKVRWKARAHMVDVEVIDGGPGLPETKNLFVPFFTTKPQGSGIGLVLSRQIAEAHGGRLTLSNRRDAKGAVATLSLPIASAR